MLLKVYYNYVILPAINSYYRYHTSYVCEETSYSYSAERSFFPVFLFIPKRAFRSSWSEAVRYTDSTGIARRFSAARESSSALLVANPIRSFREVEFAALDAADALLVD